MAEKGHPKIPLKRQAELLSINRTGIYYIAVGKSKEEISFMHAIDRIYTRWPAFGYRRSTAKLQNQGFAVNRKRVQHLMREMEIAGQTSVSGTKRTIRIRTDSGTLISIDRTKSRVWISPTFL